MRRLRAFRFAKSRAVGLSLVTWCAMVAGAEAKTVFADGVFSPGGWTLATIVNAPGQSVTAVQAPAGGNGGAFRDVDISLTEPSATVGSAAFGFNLSTASVYDPAVSGAIGSIDFSIDYQCAVTGGPCFGDGQGYDLGIEQGGRFFAFLNPATTSYTRDHPQWLTGVQSGVTQSQLNEIVPPGPSEAVPSMIDYNGHPDFSVAGAPITLGFLTWDVGGTYQIEAGYDNWSVSISAVPEPSPWVTMLVGVAALGALSRRRRSLGVPAQGVSCR